MRIGLIGRQIRNLRCQFVLKQPSDSCFGIWRRDFVFSADRILNVIIQVRIFPFLSIILSIHLFYSPFLILLLYIFVAIRSLL